jgi:chromatin structure-remodeling complex subunit RSC1/2
MARAWQMRSPPLPPFQSLPRPGSLPGQGSAPAPSEPARKVKKIRLTGASLGTLGTPDPSSSFPSTKLRLGPSGVSSAASPAPSTPSITLKLGGSRVTSGPPAGLPSLPALPLAAQPVAPSQAHATPFDSGGAIAGPSGYASQAAPTQPAPVKKEKKDRKRDRVEKDEDGEDGTPAAPLVPTVPDSETGWMGGDLVCCSSFSPFFRSSSPFHPCTGKQPVASLLRRSNKAS